VQLDSLVDESDGKAQSGWIREQDEGRRMTEEGGCIFHEDQKRPRVEG
jgi:hypothetical protein